MEQIAVPWSVAVELADHVGRIVANFLLKPEPQPYSPLPHQYARPCGFCFPLLFISQAWNRTRHVEDSSFVHTLQRKCRCDAWIEMHLLNKPCKKIAQSLMRCSRKLGLKLVGRAWTGLIWLGRGSSSRFV